MHTIMQMLAGVLQLTSCRESRMQAVSADCLLSTFWKGLHVYILMGFIHSL